MTQYLTIRSDGDYSRYAATDTLTEYLRSLPNLVPDGRMGFRSSAQGRLTQIVLAECGRSGSYAVDEYRSHVNVVELICPDEDEDSRNLAKQIAAFLGWEVVDDHAGSE